MARQRFQGQWVAMQIARADRADVPVEGEVIAHARERRALHEKARAFRSTHPAARLFIFFAGDPIPEGLAVSLANR